MHSVCDIIYDPPRNLSLDLHLPESKTADACVIYVHGGAAVTDELCVPEDGSGAKGDARQVAERLTAEGYAVAAITYRSGTGLDAFGTADAGYIQAYAARSEKLGLSLSPEFYGPALLSAVEDISRAIEFLWVEGFDLGITARNIGVWGVSAGGVAALALAYPPAHWAKRTARPDAVVAISSAFVQPWRLTSAGPPCLLINRETDQDIPLSDARLGAARAVSATAAVTLIEVNDDVSSDDPNMAQSQHMDDIIAHLAKLRDH